MEAALRTALALQAYEDILDPSEVWSFLALAAFHAKFYGTCSKVRGPVRLIRAMARISAHKGWWLMSSVPLLA